MYYTTNWITDPNLERTTMEKKYTISQVTNGYIITPDYKENLNRDDLRVFNLFDDMTAYLHKKFNEGLDKTAADKFIDEASKVFELDITTEDHNKLRKFKIDTIPILHKKCYNLPVNVRTDNCLRAARIVEVKDLLCHDNRMLSRLKNFGRKSLLDLETALLKEGLTLVKRGFGDRNKANLSDNEFMKWYNLKRSL